jgi:hypothetical protein
MKNRCGFVSNSSSSSFIVGVPDAITKDIVMDLLQVPHKSPLYGLAEEIATFFVNASRPMTIDEWLEKGEYGSLDEFIAGSSNDHDHNSPLKNMAEALCLIQDRGWQLYAGELSTEGEWIEQMLEAVLPTSVTDSIVIYRGSF